MSYNGASKTSFSPYDLYALEWIYGGDGIGGQYGIGSVNGPQVPDALLDPVYHDISGGETKLEGNAGTTAFTFTVTRSGETAQASTVNWTVTGASSDDFDGATSGTLSFAGGETSQTITVNVKGDTVAEADEAFTVTLSAPTGTNARGELGTSVAAQATITDDDTPAMVSIGAGVTVTEGNSGTTSATLTLTRSGNLNTSSEVAWQVRAGSADAEDFGGSLPSGRVTFSPGESGKTITVPVKGDTTIEDSETFYVDLTAISGATLGNRTAANTIRNDDVSNRISVSAAQAEVLEGASGTQTVSFTVARSGSSANAASVKWAASGLGADDLSGATLAGTLSFAAGESSKTLDFKVIGDGRYEPDETLTVTLSDVSGIGAVLDRASAATVITNDDEMGVVSIRAVTGDQFEGNSGGVPHDFELTRTGDLTDAARIEWSVSGTTAADDFVGGRPSGTAVFAAGQATTTISFQSAGDTRNETDETIIVTLGEGDIVRASETAGTATVTLIEDDIPPFFTIRAREAEKLEGDSGNSYFTFSVERGGNASKMASVSWKIEGGTATPGVDLYDGRGIATLSGKLDFAAGEVAKTISLPVVGDTTVEADETFVVVLHSASGATISKTLGSATGRILNDDYLPVVQFADEGLVLTEGAAGGYRDLFLTVTREHADERSNLVGWSVEAGTADATDFAYGVLPSGTLSFAQGEAEQTIKISIAGDDLAEMNESFTLRLAGSSYYDLGATASMTVTIRNDDKTDAELARAGGSGPAYNKDSAFLFDAAYYAGKCLEYGETVPVAEALERFLAGSGEAFQSPTPFFDADYYQERWPDLSGLELDPATLFAHYNLYGVWEGRSASATMDAFDGERYLADNPDVAAYVDAYIDDFLGSRSNGAIAHFTIYGEAEGRLAHELEGQLIELGYAL